MPESLRAWDGGCCLSLSQRTTLAERLQRRLERVWGMLRLPVMQKLDMVIKYTSPEMAPRLEAALAVWELAAASVMEREQSLTILEELHRYRAVGKQLPGLDQEEANALTALEVATVYALKVSAPHPQKRTHELLGLLPLGVG